MTSDRLANPVLVEATRGDLRESAHRGAIVVVDADTSTRAVVADVARRQSCTLVAVDCSAGVPDCLRGEAPALVVIELGDDGGEAGEEVGGVGGCCVAPGVFRLFL